MNVDMRINEAGKNQLPCRIDHFRSGGGIEIESDAADCLVLDVDIARDRLSAVTISPPLISNAI